MLSGRLLLLWQVRTHSPQEVSPKPLAREPTKPETRLRGREKREQNTYILIACPAFRGLISKLNASD